MNVTIVTEYPFFRRCLERLKPRGGMKGEAHYFTAEPGELIELPAGSGKVIDFTVAYSPAEERDRRTASEQLNELEQENAELRQEIAGLRENARNAADLLMINPPAADRGPSPRKR